MGSEKFKFNSALLIDDDPTDLYINKRILELGRFAKTIIIKKSCLDAIQFLKDELQSSGKLPEVIFLDYFMPVHGGKDFLERFELLPTQYTQSCKVVMLSVLDEELKPDAYNKSLTFGAMAKPLTDAKIDLVFKESGIFSETSFL